MRLIKNNRNLLNSIPIPNHKSLLMANFFNDSTLSVYFIKVIISNFTTKFAIKDKINTFSLTRRHQEVIVLSESAPLNLFKNSHECWTFRWTSEWKKKTEHFLTFLFCSRKTLNTYFIFYLHFFAVSKITNNRISFSLNFLRQKGNTQNMFFMFEKLWLHFFLYYFMFHVLSHFNPFLSGEKRFC